MLLWNLPGLKAYRLVLPRKISKPYRLPQMDIAVGSLADSSHRGSYLGVRSTEYGLLNLGYIVRYFFSCGALVRYSDFLQIKLCRMQLISIY